jgi:hypothetical protein
LSDGLLNDGVCITNNLEIFQIGFAQHACGVIAGHLGYPGPVDVNTPGGF